MPSASTSRFSCNAHLAESAAKQERTYMPGSKTTQGRTATRTHAPVRVAFRYANPRHPELI